jgi:RNA polymerase sigma-70 factor (ECF subfamily)
VDVEVTRTLQLVRRAQAGDGDALQRLFARYYGRVHTIVRLRLGRRLRTRMESGDILQEVFLAALEGFDRFELRDEAAFIRWLARLVQNRIADAADYHGAARRDLGREVRLDGTDDGIGDAPGGLDPVASGLLPPDAVDVEQQRRLVEQCLLEMPEDYRELILLRDYAGSSWADVAEETERPSPDAARMMHAKAMVELARRLQAATRGMG